MCDFNSKYCQQVIVNEDRVSLTVEHAHISISIDDAQSLNGRECNFSFRKVLSMNALEFIYARPLENRSIQNIYVNHHSDSELNNNGMMTTSFMSPGNANVNPTISNLGYENTLKVNQGCSLYGKTDSSSTLFKPESVYSDQELSSPEVHTSIYEPFINKQASVNDDKFSNDGKLSRLESVVSNLPASKSDNFNQKHPSNQNDDKIITIRKLSGAKFFNSALGDEKYDPLTQEHTDHVRIAETAIDKKICRLKSFDSAKSDARCDNLSQKPHHYLNGEKSSNSKKLSRPANLDSAIGDNPVRKTAKQGKGDEKTKARKLKKFKSFDTSSESLELNQNTDSVPMNKNTSVEKSLLQKFGDKTGSNELVDPARCEKTDLEELNVIHTFSIPQIYLIETQGDIIKFRSRRSF